VRCVFSYNDGNVDKCALVEHFGTSPVECDGATDRERCPFWAIVEAIRSLEVTVSRLEVSW